MHHKNWLIQYFLVEYNAYLILWQNSSGEKNKQKILKLKKKSYFFMHSSGILISVCLAGWIKIDLIVYLQMELDKVIETFAADLEMNMILSNYRQMRARFYYCLYTAY